LPEWIRENKALKKLAVFCLALLVLDLLLYAFLVVPAAGTLRTLEARYAELRKRRADAVLFERKKQELTGIKAGIPTQKDMPLLIKDLVQTARRLNVTVASIKYEIPDRNGEQLVPLTFSFPAEGRYADIRRFIFEIETSDRLVGMQDVTLGEDQGRVRIQMKLVTYIKGQ
jgi:Tfp pilus assembly protein PilO